MRRGQHANNGPTLYQSVSDHLLSQIQSGHFAVGSKLPTERELCDQYAIGRHTAREALRRLSDLGLIERRRRAGTTIIRQHPQAKFGVALNTTDQLQRYLELTDLHVTHVTPDLPGQPPETELPDGPAAWIKVETFRSLPGNKRPISWTDIYLRNEYESIVEKIGTQSGGVYSLLTECFDEAVESIEMEISASRFPTKVARLMGYEESDPALLMIRTFRNAASKIMEIAVSYYPPYDFRYVATSFPTT
ncbi:GntR family transcriptional regulator [Pusillimonas sp. MFBS29]|uniref:GntR family transcriptional regulator n=1 Tax=Pusillimonas sp. MFBS29 TaxID=2886690 RepID=UPI001D0F7EF2|nr:GntR family transcriptional regulator [Pusillimonas sp. MFBS29]MCC2595857.1 GntR family transcriptional regulator [Pusillimonas sp. MFBS29]